MPLKEIPHHENPFLNPPFFLNPQNTHLSLTNPLTGQSLQHFNLSSYINSKNSRCSYHRYCRSQRTSRTRSSGITKKPIFSKEQNYAVIVCITPPHTYILPIAISPLLPNCNDEFSHSCPAQGHRDVSRLLAIEEVICTNSVRLG